MVLLMVNMFWVMVNMILFLFLCYVSYRHLNIVHYLLSILILYFKTKCSFHGLRETIKLQIQYIYTIIRIIRMKIFYVE